MVLYCSFLQVQHFHNVLPSCLAELLKYQEFKLPSLPKELLYKSIALTLLFPCVLTTLFSIFLYILLLVIPC